MKKLVAVFALMLSAAPLSGCFPLVAAGATEGAVVVAQERSVGEAVDDAGIYFKIKERYSQKDVNDLLVNVSVKVVEGRVLLTGNVDKPDTQVEAVNLAWQVNGVREVISELQVNDKSSLSNYARDVWISTQIRSRLLLAKHVRSINFSVVTVNQVVYLMGIAQNQDELNRVSNVASTTSYVKQVVSYVRLKDDPRRPN